MKNLVVFIVFVLTSVMVQAQTEQSNQKEKPVLKKIARSSNERIQPEQKETDHKFSKSSKLEKQEASDENRSPQRKAELAPYSRLEKDSTEH